MKFESAVFGNRGGSHQLLESSLPSSTPVLDSLRFLVDRPAGHVGAEVRWFPYWGCQQIDRWWALWKGEEDSNAPRKNMVAARVALVPLDECKDLNDLDELFFAVKGSVSTPTAKDLALAGEIVDHLSKGKGPAVVPDLMSAPNILRSLWTRSWTSARISLSLRTLFGTEGLESVSASSIVVVPEELKPRWHGHTLIEQSSCNSGTAALWLAGKASSRTTRIIRNNTDRLPGNYAVLERLTRVVERLDRLEAGIGTPGDALVVLRTQEAFDNGLALSSDDIDLVRSALVRFDEISVEEVRGASLVRLDLFSDSATVENALSSWIEDRLPSESAVDALWIIEKAKRESYAKWWRRAVCIGVRAACQKKTSEWAKAIWDWWQARSDSVALLVDYLDDSSVTEKWLAKNAPTNVGDLLIEAISGVCIERQWAILLVRAYGSTRPLVDWVERFHSSFPSTEVVLDELLTERSENEIIDAAIDSWWLPLVERALKLTLANPVLLARTLSSDLVPLVSRHLTAGGTFPVELLHIDFLNGVFDGAILGPTPNADCLNILRRLDRRAGRILFDHPKANELFGLNQELVNGGVEEWWHRFLSTDTTERPPSSLVTPALKFARDKTRNQPVRLVIELLRIFPEISERDFMEWMNHTEYLWKSGDHELVSELLIERRWKSAAHTFRWSWKRELKLVVWNARELLSWFDQFIFAPEGANQNERKEFALVHDKMKILFLAANPNSSERLALDEEARAIEEKIRDAKHRDLVIVRTRWAVRPEDLQQVLLEDQPRIVHFSGHGGGAIGIVLHAADQNEERFIDADALADLFQVLKDDISIVVLNACYSEEQAQAIVKEIDFVVGMSDSIRDDAARVFAAAFYRGLAFGRSVRTAFDLGINELKLMGLREDVAIPRLLVRHGADSDKRLVANA